MSLDNWTFIRQKATGEQVTGCLKCGAIRDDSESREAHEAMHAKLDPCGHSGHSYLPEYERYECCARRVCSCACNPKEAVHV